MATKLEYAQLSANVYRSSTNRINRIGIPLRWSELKLGLSERLQKDSATGVSVGAYALALRGTEPFTQFGVDLAIADIAQLVADDSSGLAIHY